MKESFESGLMILFLLLAFFIIFTGGGLIGSDVTKDRYVLEGRNQAVILCIESQKDCKIEYDYLKLQKSVK